MDRTPTPIRSTLALGTALSAVLLTGACGSDEPAPVVVTTTVTTSTAPSTVTSSRAPAPSSTTPVAEPDPTTPAVVIVVEGNLCSARGAVATFSDGATAYCARLQYTDASAWSRNPSLAPNLTAEPVAPVGPQLGDQCIGADVGRTSVDAEGNAILCDNYQWVLNVGQTARHPWADSQGDWSDCISRYDDEEYCRTVVDPTG